MLISICCRLLTVRQNSGYMYRHPSADQLHLSSSLTNNMTAYPYLVDTFHKEGNRLGDKTRHLLESH